MAQAPFRPADSLSLSWHEAPASSGAHHTPRRLSGVQQSITRVDPSSMQAAGARVGNPHELRGVAIVQPGFQQNPTRETAKHAIFGGGPERAPNTPLRGVGGNSSMNGILSTPEAVPQNQATQRSTGRGKQGLNSRSQIELTDAPAAGMPSTNADSAANSRFLGISTKSTVSMSTDIDDTPLHTGKGFTNSRNNHSQFKLAANETANAEEQEQKRPQTASTAMKNRSNIQLGDTAHSFQHGAAAADRPAAGLAMNRPDTANGRSSDIFFQTADTSKESVARSQKAHVAPQLTIKDNPDGLPNLGMNSSRKNQESAGLYIGGSRPQTAAAAPTSPSNSQIIQSLTNGGQAQHSLPPNSSGSLIPQLRFGNNSGANPAAVPVAGLASTHRVPEDPVYGYPTSRRAYGNAKNASSLFESPDMVALQPKEETPKQIPDLPSPPKRHLKIVRHETGTAVKNLLVWQ